MKRLLRCLKRCCCEEAAKPPMEVSKEYLIQRAIKNKNSAEFERLLVREVLDLPPAFVGSTVTVEFTLTMEIKEEDLP